MTIHQDHPCHPANYAKGRAQGVRFLVIHYVGATGGARANAKYYGSTPGIGASAHYFLDHGPDAEVWASVPEGDTAWHCGRTDGKYKHPECRNANSIGIELCCRQDENGGWYFDPETVDRAVELAREIMARYGIPAERMLRHYDVTGKSCPRPWVVDPEGWEAFKRRLGDDMTKEEVQKLVEEALSARDEAVERSIQTVSTWASPAWEKAVQAGVFDGTRPGGPLTREQAAVVLARLKLL